MPCRNKLCQRAVTQISSPGAGHIWISDDALAQAFNRFARVSNAGRKRYGSNVPGPLEAHRRSAKRRMAMATSGMGAPPMLDLGSFFRLRPLPQTSWRWEAPASVQEPSKSKKRTSFSPLSAESWTTLLSTALAKYTRSKEHAVQAASFCDTRRHEFAFIEASKNAFERLYQDVVKDGVLHVHDMRTLCDFLSCAANEQNARNTEALMSHLEGQSITPASLGLLVDTICDKIDLGTIGINELAAVIDRMALLSLSKDSDEPHAMLRAFERCWSSVIRSTEATAVKLDSDVVGSMLRCVATLTVEYESLRFLLSVLKDSTLHSKACNDTVLATGFSLALRSITTCASKTQEDGSVPTNSLLEALDILPADRSDDVVIMTTETMLEHATSNNRKLKRAVTLWHKALMQSCHMTRERFSSVSWPNVHGIIAKHFRPSSLAPLFAGLDSGDLARILLQNFVPRVAFVDDGVGSFDQDLLLSDLAVRKSPQRFEDLGVVLMSSRPPVRHILPTKDISAIIIHLQAALDNSLHSLNEEIPTAFEPLTELIRLLHRYKVSYGEVLHEIVRIMTFANDTQGLFEFLTRLVRSSVEIPPSVGVSLIKHFLKCGQLDLAQQTYDLVDGIWLSECHELPLALIESGPISAQRLFAMLNRSGGLKLPHNLRAPPRLAINEAHINLVSLVAYTIAKSPHYKPRIAFRRVHECYRYLLDRGVPPSALLSRAFVTAGVIRPLQQGLWVSTIKFRFILSIVASAEGQEIAQGIDVMAYKWRTQVVQERYDGDDFAAYSQESEHMIMRDWPQWDRSAWSKASTKKYLLSRRKMMRKWPDRVDEYAVQQFIEPFE